MKVETTNVVVLGGGYAGVIAALRLAGKSKRRQVNVTLVNAASTVGRRYLRR